MSCEIKSIDHLKPSDTIIPINKDIVIHGRPMDLYRIPGFVHTIGGKYHENCYYVCPEGEPPTVTNLTPFDGEWCIWGFVVQNHNYVNSHMGDSYVETSCKVIITRNDQPFYSFGCRDMSYGAAKAQVLITQLEEHPLDFQRKDYESKIIGRHIYYDHVPAIIVRYHDGEIFIEPDGDKFMPHVDEVDDEYDRSCWIQDYSEGLRTHIFSEKINWFRD